MTARFLIYSKPGCPFCDKAKSLLDLREIPYRTVELETEEQQQQFVASLKGWRTFPAIFALDDSEKPVRFVGGYDALSSENPVGE